LGAGIAVRKVVIFADKNWAGLRTVINMPGNKIIERNKSQDNSGNDHRINGVAARFMPSDTPSHGWHKSRRNISE
jgi:hypothetical protein